MQRVDKAADARRMDGRAQLEAAARAIGGASDVDRAWAGTGAALEMRKQCGICSEHQPVRVPFLRHVCISCAALWVPGICGDCAHTSITFTIDGQLSPFATCGCGGQLRQIAWVPKPREYVAPEVAAAHQEAVTRSHTRARWMWRVLLVVAATCATVGGVRVFHQMSSAPPRTAVVRTPVPPDSASQSTQLRGQLAAERLQEDGRPHDAFSCAAVLPDLSGSSSVSAAAERQAFLSACLAG